MRKTPRVQSISFALILIAIVLASRPASAGTYSFVKVMANTSKNYPAINNAGLAAFSSGGGVYVGNGSSATQINPPGLTAITGFQAVTINDSGEVAFNAIQGPLDRYSFYRGTTAGVTKVLAPQSGYTLGPLPAIADDGTISAFYGGQGWPFVTSGVSVIASQGGSIATINSNPALDMTNDYGVGAPNFQISSSHNGNLAYFWKTSQFNAFDVRAVIDGQPHTVASFLSNPADPAGVYSMAINNAGVVAISGLFNSQNAGLFIAQNGSLTRVVTASLAGPYNMLDAVSLNNHGDYAFFGSTQTLSGIFTGPDPQANKLIATGDELDGSTVKSLAFGTDGLNDQGQVVFWALLNDGRTGVYVANPVPEPSTMVLAGTALLTLCVMRRWRKPHRRGLLAM
jgi:hypothetical protein